MHREDASKFNARRRKAAGDDGADDAAALGCGKCRWTSKGCTRCRAPGFQPGPREVRAARPAGLLDKHTRDALGVVARCERGQCICYSRASECVRYPRTKRKLKLCNRTRKMYKSKACVRYPRTKRKVKLCNRNTKNVQEQGLFWPWERGRASRVAETLGARVERREEDREQPSERSEAEKSKTRLSEAHAKRQGRRKWERVATEESVRKLWAEFAQTSTVSGCAGRRRSGAGGSVRETSGV
eukprot:6189795-Pleurochrysis_carterae.AAC.3